MIKTIIKRDGSEELYLPEKLNRWSTWAAKTLGDKVDWPSIVLQTVSQLPEVCTSDFLQEQLIKTCLDNNTWSYNKMAGRLYAALIKKRLYNNKLPTVKDLQSKLVDLGLMVPLKYTDDEFSKIETIINHNQDFKYAHFQLHTDLTKYSISNRVTKEYYESPQYMYMRMAMALAEDQPEDRKMVDLEKWYTYLSNGYLNAPTPYHVNLGTALKGYASCCLIASGDTAKSLAIGDHIAYTMTYSSAGIGMFHDTRTLGDPVRGGAVSHQGKLNYYRATVAAVKANMQNGRGGACTEYFNVYDPEFETLVQLKNPMSTDAKKIRGMDYSWGSNKFFARKVAKNEDIFTFTSFSAPDLYNALYSSDQNEFERLYNKYEQDESFKKNYVSARERAILGCNEWYETGRIYEHYIDEMNRHTPFKDKIYSSNLCSEIDLPTSPYMNMQDLYSQKEVNSEVALCSLAGICVSALPLHDDALYEDVAYYALLMIDKCINMAHYELPNIGVTAKSRMSAGVGIIGLAYLLARNGKNYSSDDGKKFIHYVAERHSYMLIKASLKLGKELGNAKWINKTKWVDGWLPIDDYNKNVDSICDFELKYDWETLRSDIVKNKGIRNSALVAHMPSESSANSSGTTNGVYPIRFTTMMKTDNNRVNYWAAPDSDKANVKYESAWDISTEDLLKCYAIIQKFADQGISADFYRNLSKAEDKVTSTEMIHDYLNRVKFGLKSKYYMNTLTSNQNIVNEENDVGYNISENEEPEVCESCTL